ncbi:uncharacterized protein BXZ73DRAFT_88026 [Epithele typhae]|uniref:uncharacterized protein n=1 Tax=Epithele typhae TaxID=378194 RepID=UPI0020078009|nr:uncharacterized protein BXZ73DRAFT_88026 [Epithele typhae]KAH9942455.1 hypothetical protein BXZ73DRAFT_88026 [Epithele typhae]
MSFPALLRTSVLSDRFAHLSLLQKAPTAPTAPRRNSRDDKEGKRWVRRKENARFVGNAHIVAPSKKDFGVPVPSVARPSPRNGPVPAATPILPTPESANAGRFSLSLKGMRRELRRAGRAREARPRREDALLGWLAAGGVLLAPDAAAEMHFPGTPVDDGGAVLEVSRTPLQLVWSIEDNAFSRYVVHCCARYHDIVSFSKDTSGHRLTYLLRPNVTRPARYAAPALDTPPVTDLSELSATELDSESDFASERDLSDAEGGRGGVTGHQGGPGLTAIVEASADSMPPSPVPYAVRAPADFDAFDDDDWSSDREVPNVGRRGDFDSDADAPVLAEAQVAVPSSLAPDLRRRQGPDALRSRLLERQRRAASSPSRSPARRTPHRPRQRAEPVKTRAAPGRRSFYDYLYA